MPNKSITNINDISWDVIENVAKDYITSSLTANAKKEIASKFELSEDTVNQILKYWLKEKEKTIFESALNQLVNDKKDFYNFWKKYEEKAHKKISFSIIWTYFYHSIKMKEYCYDDISRFFFYLLNKKSVHHYILGGNINSDNSIFQPIFIHEITHPEQASLLEVKEDKLCKISKQVYSKVHFYYADPYQITKLITAHNCNAFILAHSFDKSLNIYENFNDRLNFPPVTIKRIEQMLKLIGVKLIDDIEFYPEKGKINVSSARLNKELKNKQYYTIKDINFLGTLENLEQIEED